MAILERHIQSIKNEKAYWEWEEKWAALEKNLGGFPAKKHYSLISGSEPMGTMVWEREWESFTAAEAAYDRMWSNPDSEKLGSSGLDVISSERIEYYFVPR